MQLDAEAGLPPGPFSHADALRAGFSPAAIRHRLSSRAWIRLRRGVFVTSECWQAGTQRDRHLMNAMAALLLAPAGAVVSHESAVLWHGLETLDRRIPTHPSVTAWLPRSVRAPAATSYRLKRAALPSSHVCRDGSLPVTAPARTVVDMGRTVPFAAGVVLADSALRLRLCSLEALHATYYDCQTWPGGLAAGRAVHFADPKAESAFESYMRVGLHLQGLPTPQTQVPIRIGRYLYRPDFWWEKERTIGEADGLLKYANDQALRDEKLREDRLRDMGFEVVRVTWQQMRDEPEVVAQRFRAAFERGRRRG
jgi:very-short-patch-repair endonuclease